MNSLLLKRVRTSVFALSAVAFLAACESDEEKAAKYFESGIDLLEAGDVDRALIEFRNVFKLQPSHREARTAYAKAVREQGRQSEAFGQYLRLVEYYPDDLEGQIALAEMALQNTQIEEFERYSGAAAELAPEDPRVQNLMLASRYITAVRGEDDEVRLAQLQEALEQQAEQPESLSLRLVAIDGLMSEQRFSAAIEQIDLAIAQDPSRRTLYNTKLVALSALEDAEGIRLLLQEMIRQFPEDETISQNLIRFLLSQGDSKAAEEFLREQALMEDAEIEDRMVLIRFVEQVNGREAARAEVQAFIDADIDVLRMKSLMAGFDFDEGRQQEAIDTLEALISESEPSEARRRSQVLLARFLDRTGNGVGGRAIIEEVLNEDPSMVPALEMRAAWLISEDRSDEAISALRIALDQEPEDVSVMSLMARAHIRSGNRSLAGDLLALAATTSDFAGPETIAHANFLIQDENYLVAEEALLNALRRNPANTDVLVKLGETYVLLEDWARARQVASSLRDRNDDRLDAVADNIELQVISAQQGAEEAMQFLSDLANSDSSVSISANSALVSAMAQDGDFEGAQELVASLIEQNPNVLQFRVLEAAVFSAAGRLDEAEAKYEEILEDVPAATPVWMQLLRLQARDGRPQDAEATLDRALEVLPEAPDLLWAKASLLERNGDRQGALDVYEALYEVNTNSPVVANNLASLLTQLDQSPEAVDRAYRVARRLRGIEVPAFQDTYGWIEYLRGNYDVAIENLEMAAAGLPDDPVVQMHLGLAYLAAERRQDASEVLEKAVQIAGSERADLVTNATEALAELDSTVESGEQN